MKNYSIFDAHCDTLCHIANRGVSAVNNGCGVDINLMRDYSEYTQVYACFIAPEYYDNPKARFEKLYDCFAAQDFTGIKPVLSLEGAEMIESLEDVDRLYQCGVRCVALTWNYPNRLAGGADDTDRGLTEFGKAVIRKMENLGILIDVSHLNDKSFYDVISVISRPVIATHSNSRTICRHRRNLTDEMFKLICECGGCVGMNFYPLFLTEKKQCGLSDIVMHIEHFLNLDGEDCIGLGTDFDGIDYTPVDISDCGDVYKLFDELKKRGISDRITEKISNKNFKRLFWED